MAATVRVRMRNPKNLSTGDAAKPLIVLHLQGTGFVTQKLSSVKLKKLVNPPELVGKLHAFGGGTQARVTIRIKPGGGGAPSVPAPEPPGAGMDESDPVPDDLALTIDNPPPGSPP